MGVSLEVGRGRESRQKSECAGVRRSRFLGRQCRTAILGSARVGFQGKIEGLRDWNR